MEYNYPSVSEYFKNIGSPFPPGKDIQQQAFDYSQEPLIVLSNSRIGKEYQAKVNWALSEYNYDLMHVRPLQQNLMLHWLPICMEYWQQSLHAKKGYDFVYFLHDALYQKQDIIAETVGKEIQNITFQFMRNTLLALLSSQRELDSLRSGSSPYKWIPRFNSFVGFSDELENILNAWGKMDSYGFAISYFQYISCLVFDDSDNPVFPQHKSHKFTYPPSLDEMEDMYDMCYWSKKKIAVYEEWLNFNNVRMLLQKANLHFSEDSTEAHIALKIEQALIEDRDAFDFRVLEFLEMVEK